MHRRRALSLFAAVTAVAGLLTAPTAGAVTPHGAEASDGPGATSHQDQARKDCVGTARNTTSKIWFTVANGVLSDVYAPTVDATNVETMQYLVSDGSTFTDLQERDTTYTAVADATGMECTVTSTAKSGAYQLVTTYLTDPDRNSVVVHTQYVPLTDAARTYRLYVRLDANAGGNGGGGTANGGADTAVVDNTTGTPIPVSFDTNTTSQSPRRYAVPSYVALAGSRPFTAVSSGFVGAASDGLTQLDGAHALGPITTTARSGNVEQTAAIQRDRDGSTTLALGFGTSRSAAVNTATATSGTSVARMSARYLNQWQAYDNGLRRPALDGRGLGPRQQATATSAYYRSANVVKASEDKTFPGAIVAGLDAPWGQSIVANDPSNLFASGYREVFARDLYEAWTALYTDGDLATAQDTVRFLLTKSQQANGSQPRNAVLDGTKAADSFNDQLDESAYPLLMAVQSGLGSDPTLWPHIRREADFLISHGPSFGVERWEEQTGYSPSTIAAEIAGLVAAGTIAQQRGSAAEARTWLATADEYQRMIKTWGVTHTGSLSDKPYFIRLSKTGDPDAAISYNLGNGGQTVDQRSVADLGFLEYVRLGILPAADRTVANSLHVVDDVLQHQTDNGPGWLRYNGDGYGDCIVADPSTSCTVDGAPWTLNFSGTGHIWPVLGVERAQQYLATGSVRAAGLQLATTNAMNSGPGLVPEQVWDGPDLPRDPYGTDPSTASIGFVNGEADGSASPLTWGSASQVRLTADLAAGRSVEQPVQVYNRYVRNSQATTPLTVTAPGDETGVGRTVTVTGTAVAGALVDVAAVATDDNTKTTRVVTTVGRDGTFSVPVAATPGTNVLVITSTTPTGATAQVVRTVASDVVNGTLIYSHNDPTGDDNGPGKYAYPTSSNFHAGAFDLTDFQVYDSGSTVTFRVQTADLSPTFGSTNGAQLVDLYVRNPDATSFSTDPSYSGMNYTIDTGSAWSRLIEVQGFGNERFIDPSGTSVGSVAVRANSVSRYTTFTVDKSALGGTPGSGWGLTVALTGQDGTHGFDQTRGFTSTPGEYSFGVCATNDGTPLCSADPNTVPKVLDTIVPDGVMQSDELDYTAHNPVALQGVTLP